MDDLGFVLLAGIPSASWIGLMLYDLVGRLRYFLGFSTSDCTRNFTVLLARTMRNITIRLWGALAVIFNLNLLY
jgi:hypothetical protein